MSDTFMKKLKGKLTELHIEGACCYGIIYLDKTVQYFPFVTLNRTATEKIQKGNNHYILHGGFINSGGTSYHDSKVRFYVEEVEEVAK